MEVKGAAVSYPIYLYIIHCVGCILFIAQPFADSQTYSVFGKPTAPPKERTYMSLEERVWVRA